SHGLAISLRQDPVARAEIERMARLISGETSGTKYELALVRAESELVLRRARMASVVIIERALNAGRRGADQRPGAHPGLGADTDALAPAATPATCTEALGQALPQLLRLKRYARRAFLRGDRAARRLAAISYGEAEPFDDPGELA